MSNQQPNPPEQPLEEKGAKPNPTEQPLEGETAKLNPTEQPLEGETVKPKKIDKIPSPLNKPNYILQNISYGGAFLVLLRHRNFYFFLF